MNLLKFSLAAASIAAISAVNAATFATSDSSAGSFTGGDVGVTITHNFTVGSLGAGETLSVSSLGVFDAGANGIIGGNALVVLFDSQGNSLANATISGTQGTLLGNYRYTSLANSVTLNPNTSYKLTAFLAPGNNVGVNPPDSLPTIGSPFTITSEQDAWTGIQTPGSKYKVASFEYTVVPEPETYAMVAGLGLVGFGLWRRRQA